MKGIGISDGIESIERRSGRCSLQTERWTEGRANDDPKLRRRCLLPVTATATAAAEAGAVGA